MYNINIRWFDRLNVDKTVHINITEYNLGLKLEKRLQGNRQKGTIRT